MTRALKQLRNARMRALLDGNPQPVNFSFWDDPELLTVDGSDAFEIHFNDMIDDWFGISAAMIVEALIAADGRDVLVHLNSPGGMVTEGLSIHSQFKQYGGKVTMRIEGLAASAASFVMLAADEVIIEPSAMVMVHDAWDYTAGPEIEHRRVADLLGKISNNIAGMYAAKAGGDVDHWRDEMTKNGDLGSWYIGAEAVDVGLVDRLTDDDTTEDGTAAAARWSGIFAKAPRRPASRRVDPSELGTEPERLVPAAPLDIPDADFAEFIDRWNQQRAANTNKVRLEPAALAAGTPAAALDFEGLRNILKGLVP